jgi:hypothetical protein
MSLPSITVVPCLLLSAPMERTGGVLESSRASCSIVLPGSQYTERLLLSNTRDDDEQLDFIAHIKQIFHKRNIVLIFNTACHVFLALVTLSYLSLSVSYYDIFAYTLTPRVKNSPMPLCLSWFVCFFLLIISYYLLNLCLVDNLLTSHLTLHHFQHFHNFFIKVSLSSDLKAERRAKQGFRYNTTKRPEKNKRSYEWHISQSNQNAWYAQNDDISKSHNKIHSPCTNKSIINLTFIIPFQFVLRLYYAIKKDSVVRFMCI